MRTPHPCHAAIALLSLQAICGCQSHEAAPKTPAPAKPVSTVAAQPAPVFVPVSVDLRDHLTTLGLTPRAQGARGTCSIFTTCEAIEYAMAVRDGHITRQSPEFLNWAGAQAIGHPSDGNFFHNALNGFERYGMCDEQAMPYAPTYDAARAPSDAALKDATKARAGMKVHWIVPWNAGKTGVSEEEFNEIKRVLRSGYPVAAGSSHSRLLVGYVDDAKLPGGGKFLTEDSALARFDEVTYEFVRSKVNDVFWVEAETRAKM